MAGKERTLEVVNRTTCSLNAAVGVGNFAGVMRSCKNRNVERGDGE